MNNNTNESLIEYIKRYAFETSLVHPAGINLWKAIAVNLGGATWQAFEGVWRKECPNGCPESDGIDWDGECLQCHGRGYTRPYDIALAFVRSPMRECPECEGLGKVPRDYLDATVVPCGLCKGKGCISGDVWCVWIFSDRDHVNCGNIARSFGGGGSKEVAEFQCEVLPFEITDPWFEYPLESFTCHGCKGVEKCKYAWDEYNTNGDCLAEK